MNGRGYNIQELQYELINGNGKVKEFNKNGELEFKGEFLNGERMEKEKNIRIIYYYLKENIKMEKNIMIMVN